MSLDLQWSWFLMNLKFWARISCYFYRNFLICYNFFHFSMYFRVVQNLPKMLDRAPRKCLLHLSGQGQRQHTLNQLSKNQEVVPPLLMISILREPPWHAWAAHIVSEKSQENIPQAEVRINFRLCYGGAAMMRNKYER